MKTARSELTPEQKAELEGLAAPPDEGIDTADVPEARDWSGAKRGLFFRPVKRRLTLRLDADLIDWFRRQVSEDEGYQTRINRAPREYVQKREADAPLPF